MKCALVVCLLGLFAMPVIAQDEATVARTAAGCGADNTQFDVKTDKSQHPQAQASEGKAVVYVFEELRTPNELSIGSIIIRIGLDGHWIGADHEKAYFYFTVDPGDHSICANWQSSLKSLSRLSAAISVTAEAGKSYYVEAKVADGSGRHVPQLWLEPLDPAEAQLMIASNAFSTSGAKK